MRQADVERTGLVHLASGVGNIVLATPLLIALNELGWQLDVCLDADYAETIELLRPWSLVREVHTGGVIAAARRRRYTTIVPAVPPFYWARFKAGYSGSLLGAPVVARPSDRLFVEDEQAYYLQFARTLGYTGDRPVPTLPVAPRADEMR